MTLCTNEPRCAEAWLPAPPAWTRGLPALLPREIRGIVQRLLPAVPIVTGSIEFPRPWQHAIVVEHAARSQFDVLVGALRASAAVPHGFLCLAGSGDGLHGQRGRAWAAVRGNLHLSVFLSPGETGDRRSGSCRLDDIAAGLTILPTVSLVQVLDSMPGLERRAGIRWVNDVLVEGSKLAGSLVHTQSSAGRVTGILIGIGLNIGAVPPVRGTVFVPSVTALRDHVSDPRACAPPEILRRLLCTLALNYERLVDGRGSELLEFYRERSVVVGRHVEVYPDDDGLAPSRSAAGRVAAIGDRLELILAGGGRPVSSGRIVLPPSAGVPS